MLRREKRGRVYLLERRGIRPAGTTQLAQHVSGIVRDPVFFQELKKFLFITFPFMMGVLICYVTHDIWCL